MRISSSQLVLDMQESVGAWSCSSISQGFKTPNVGGGGGGGGGGGV